MAKKDRDHKVFSLTDKMVKKYDIKPSCMGKKCKDNDGKPTKTTPLKVEFHTHIKRSDDGGKRYTFRVSGECNRCGTNVSLMVGREKALSILSANK